jgi:serine protease AprX
VLPPSEGGYGRIDVTACRPGQADRAITVVDETNGLRTGEERSYGLQIPTNASLRVVLCWYDAPGERLINDLDLTLVRPDGGSTPIAPDRANTVEVIDAPRLAAGRYIVRVSAFNVPESPQPFAIAVSVMGPPAAT